MVVAIVARALGCHLHEMESIQLMLQEGLRAEQIEQILAHLTSPGLDPAETLIASFARDTVWYEPARIQRHGRKMMQTLSREEFIEFVAVASLANMICRLGIILGAR